MTLKYGEVGKGIYVSVGFDVNATPFSELTITFKLGSQEFTRNTSDGVTAPAVDSPALPNLGVIPANTYVLYTTQATDWDATGFGTDAQDSSGTDEWCLFVTYEDATPRKLIGDHGAISIESGTC